MGAVLRVDAIGWGAGVWPGLGVTLGSVDLIRHCFSARKPGLGGGWVANSGLAALLLDEMWTVCRRLEQLAMPEVAMEAHPTETMSEDALTILQLSSRRKRHPWVLVV